MAERVLITGGAGFIGSRLAARHLLDGDVVHIVTRPGSTKRAPDDVAVHAINLADPTEVAECLATARPTLIYHLASDSSRSYDPAAPLDRGSMMRDMDNLIALLGAIIAVRPELRSLVRAGSLAEYGEGTMPSTEDQREDPVAPYAAAMVAGAHYCRMLQPRLNFPVRTARLGLTYGPGQSRDFMVPWLIERCLDGQDSTLHAPSCRRDMVYVDDAVEGLRRLALSGHSGKEIVNIASGTAPTVREIAGHVARACGYDAARFRFGKGRTRGAHTLWGVNTRAVELLGWRPTVQLVDGLARTVRAHRAERQRASAPQQMAMTV